MVEIDWNETSHLPTDVVPLRLMFNVPSVTSSVYFHEIRNKLSTPKVKCWGTISTDSLEVARKLTIFFASQSSITIFLTIYFPGTMKFLVTISSAREGNIPARIWSKLHWPDDFLSSTEQSFLVLVKTQSVFGIVDDAASLLTSSDNAGKSG